MITGKHSKEFSSGEIKQRTLLHWFIQRNLSHQPLNLSHSPPGREEALYLETWVVFAAVKINLDMYTKLPQTSSTFIPEAVVYEFLYKLMVTTCLNCMAYVIHRHHMPMSKSALAPKHNSR